MNYSQAKCESGGSIFRDFVAALKQGFDLCRNAPIGRCFALAGARFPAHAIRRRFADEPREKRTLGC